MFQATKSGGEKEKVTDKKILVIDDEDDIRQLIQTCLEIMGGWQVLTARSGKEGLICAINEQPNAILLDVMMPDEDGLTTLQKLQNHSATSSIPVVLLTAKGRFVEQKFTELGVKAVLNKPFNPLRIADQIAAVLN